MDRQDGGFSQALVAVTRQNNRMKNQDLIVENEYYQLVGQDDDISLRNLPKSGTADNRTKTDSKIKAENAAVLE